MVGIVIRNSVGLNMTTKCRRGYRLDRISRVFNVGGLEGRQEKEVGIVIRNSVGLNMTTKCRRGHRLDRISRVFNAGGLEGRQEKEVGIVIRNRARLNTTTKCRMGNQLDRISKVFNACLGWEGRQGKEVGLSMSVRLNMVTKCVKEIRHDRISTMNDLSTGEEGSKEKEVGLVERTSARLNSVKKCIKGNRYDRISTLDGPNGKLATLGEFGRDEGERGMASWEMISGKVYVMLNAHYRTCNLTPRHVYVVSHTHYRTCTLSSKHECLYVLFSTGGQQCNFCCGLQFRTGATMGSVRHNLKLTRGMNHGAARVVKIRSDQLDRLITKTSCCGKIGTSALWAGLQQ